MTRLDVSGVSVTFGGLRAVREASLHVESGEILGLIGPNGAGKSTLLNSISGFVLPSSGTVTLDGQRLSGRPMDEIAASGIGRVFQHPELIADLSIRENLAIACHGVLTYGTLAEMFALPSARRQEEAAWAEVDRVVAQLGLTDSADRPVGKLPYGHRKLVELGRALLMRSRVVLLDEPVAGLNDIEIRRLIEILNVLRSELRLAVILVEHNMAFVAQVCDRLVVLDAGTVIASGIPETVLRDPLVMSSYLGEEA
jgi:ABC-type branched-subunit amino acid transport system ATPase component